MGRPKITQEVRDSGSKGFYLNKLLLEFNLVSDLSEANTLIRAGKVELNNSKIKDIEYFISPRNTYMVKIAGELVVEATVL